MFCVSCGISSLEKSEKMCCKLNRLNSQHCIIQNAFRYPYKKENSEANYLKEQESTPSSCFSPHSPSQSPNYSPTYNAHSPIYMTEEMY
jgi:hypothetical protein